jgi:integrase
MSKQRGFGNGSIDQRGENTWRLRYRVDGRRYSKVFHGTKSDARKELRALIRSGDIGAHVQPDRITVEEWAAQWLDLGAPGRKAKRANPRSVERYGQILRRIMPTIGSRRLQELRATEIDALYVDLAARGAPWTGHRVHVVLGACLATAMRKGLIAANPMERVGQVPSAGESDHGVALDADELRRLIEGFRTSALFPIVATAALTGARRNEILALRWTDFDAANRTLRIERALEADTGAVKSPKTKRGTRSITIDDSLVALLIAEREKYLRLVAGVSAAAAVELALVRLPAGALIFPSPFGDKFDLTRPRSPSAVSKMVARHARKLGFKELRFHDLRGAHETALLDAGVPVHTVAARCGHDPAVLLRNYAKRTRKADVSAAAVIGNLSKDLLGR